MQLHDNVLTCIPAWQRVRIVSPHPRNLFFVDKSLRRWWFWLPSLRVGNPLSFSLKNALKLTQTRTSTIFCLLLMLKWRSTLRIDHSPSTERCALPFARLVWVSYKTQDWCERHFPSFWKKELWPPSLPDSNPLDLCVWSILEKMSALLLTIISKLCKSFLSEHGPKIIKKRSVQQERVSGVDSKGVDARFQE